MTRSLVGSSAAVLTLFLLGACSGNGGDVAADPEAGGSSSAPTSPTAAPTVGTYPAFGSDDYTEAAQVTVAWPAGQDYPDSVFVDQSKMTCPDPTSWSGKSPAVSPG